MVAAVGSSTTTQVSNPAQTGTVSRIAAWAQDSIKAFGERWKCNFFKLTVICATVSVFVAAGGFLLQDALVVVASLPFMITAIISYSLYRQIIKQEQDIEVTVEHAQQFLTSCQTLQSNLLHIEGVIEEKVVTYTAEIDAFIETWKESKVGNFFLQLLKDHVSSVKIGQQTVNACTKPEVADASKRHLNSLVQKGHSEIIHGLVTRVANYIELKRRT